MLCPCKLIFQLFMSSACCCCRWCLRGQHIQTFCREFPFHIAFWICLWMSFDCFRLWSLWLLMRKCMMRKMLLSVWRCFWGLCLRTGVPYIYIYLLNGVSTLVAFSVPSELPSPQILLWGVPGHLDREWAGSHSCIKYAKYRMQATRLNYSHKNKSCVMSS